MPAWCFFRETAVMPQNDCTFSRTVTRATIWVRCLPELWFKKLAFSDTPKLSRLKRQIKNSNIQVSGILAGLGQRDSATTTSRQSSVSKAKLSAIRLIRFGLSMIRFRFFLAFCKQTYEVFFVDQVWFLFYGFLSSVLAG